MGLFRPLPGLLSVVPKSDPAPRERPGSWPKEVEVPMDDKQVTAAGRRTAFRPKTPAATRVDRHLETVDGSGCVRWTGATRHGYPVIRDTILGRTERVDIVISGSAWERTCGDKLCCNAEHFYLRAVPIRVPVRSSGKRPPFIEIAVRERRKITPSGCWEYQGARNAAGYGVASGRLHSGELFCGKSVHRVAYMEMVGDIPDGMHIDHLCRNRACFNPDHLDLVTPKENVRRGLCGVLTTHCPQGHEYTPENTYLNTRTNNRRCRTCHREREALRRATSRKAA